MQLHLLSAKEILAFEGTDDERARVGREIGEIADRARTRALGSAERLAHEIRDVGLAVLAGGSRGLDEHGLQTEVIVQISQ